MRISDWSSDVCSSDLADIADLRKTQLTNMEKTVRTAMRGDSGPDDDIAIGELSTAGSKISFLVRDQARLDAARERLFSETQGAGLTRSEEHTSELQSLMRISYAVFCLKKKKIKVHSHTEK